MKLFFIIFILSAVIIFTPIESETSLNTNPTLYSKSKFFVKTKNELRISEATGKVLLETGLKTLDEKINKFNIVGIKNVFRLNNGNPEIYNKYEMSKIYIFDIDTNDYADLQKVLEEFKEDDAIEFCEPNYIGSAAGVREKISKLSINQQKKDTLENLSYANTSEPNDEMFSKQWYMDNKGFMLPSGGGSAKIGADINILKTWEIESGSEDVIVAILDSGIKDDHPDLVNRMWINTKEIPGNGIDDDFNGYTDDYKGWDFAYDDRRPEDGFGHGTNIATVIGASTNNIIGFAGIDKKCRLMNCKNLNSDNTGEYSWWSESIKYAVDNGAKIINMSEGGDDYSRVLETAINYALDNNVLVVSAMMNKGDGRDYYPASIEGVVAVGATDSDDLRCKSFTWGGGSCWGSHISVVAPGNRIYGLDYEDNFNYEVYWSGTSQSTAIVSGIASLLFSQDKSRSADDLKKIIKVTSKDLVGDSREDKPGWDKFYGYGRVDSYSALTFENYNLIENTDEQFQKNEEIIKEEETKKEQDIDKSSNDTEKPVNKNTAEPARKK